jgi:hypothetical protein
VGVQSLNADVRKLIGRPNSDAQIARAIDLCREHGIGMFVDQIFGLPGETEDDCRKIERFYDEHPPDCVSVYWLDLWGGAEILQQAVNAGSITQETADAIRQHAEPGDISTRRRYHNDFARPYAARLEVRNYFPRHVSRWLVRTGLWRVLSLLNAFRFVRIWYAFTRAWDLQRFPSPREGYDLSWARFPRFFLHYLKLRVRTRLTRTNGIVLSTLPPVGVLYEQRTPEERARSVGDRPAAQADTRRPAASVGVPAA